MDTEKPKLTAPIVRQFDHWIILAQDERDYKSKVRKIKTGDYRGFYSESDKDRFEFMFTS